MTALHDRVSTVRAFNRAYTKTIGVLDEGLVNTPYSLPEARVLYELHQREHTDVTELRRELNMDAGYLSRLLGKLEARELVARQRSSEDARRQIVRLTPDGTDAIAVLDARTAAQITELLNGLSEDEQRRMTEAMDTIHGLIGGRPRTAEPRIVLRAPRPGELGWVIERHGARYTEEYGWDAGFEALVARIVADFANDHDPEREAAWIAELNGRPVGCVFCMRGTDTTAKLRLLLVEPEARGHGAGGMLVDECLRFARAAGYHDIELWTNDVLAAARRIYQRAGFELIDEQPHHSFGHDLVGQTWRRAL